MSFYHHSSLAQGRCLKARLNGNRSLIFLTLVDMTSLFFETCPPNQYDSIMRPLYAWITRKDPVYRYWLGACPRFSVYASLYRGLVINQGFPLSILLELMPFIGDNKDARVLVFHYINPLPERLYHGCFYLAIALDKIAMFSLLNAEDGLNNNDVSPVSDPDDFLELVHRLGVAFDYRFKFKVISTYKIFLCWPRNATDTLRCWLSK